MLEAPVALDDPILRAVAFLIRTEEVRRTTGITEGAGSHARRPGRSPLRPAANPGPASGTVTNRGWGSPEGNESGGCDAPQRQPMAEPGGRSA